MAKKKHTATQRLRSNIKRVMRGMEKRGYTIPQEIKEKIDKGKYQTLKSFQEKGYKKLYSQSTAESGGKIVSGFAKRSAERSEAGKKGAQTRKQRDQAYRDYIEWLDQSYNYEPTDVSSYSLPIPDHGLLSEGELVFSNLMDLIEEYPTKGSNYLNNILSREISQYGQDAVLKALAQVPEDAIREAQIIAHYEDDGTEIARSIRNLSNMIKGTIENDLEAMEMGDLLDEL